MKRLATILMLIVAIFVGGHSAWAEEFESYKMDGTVGKSPVNVYIKANTSTGRASGWYYYNSQGSKKKIQLTGTVTNYKNGYGTMNVNLTEKVDGKVTGTFSGVLSLTVHQSLVYKGTWTSPAGKKLKFEFYDNWGE